MEACDKDEYFERGECIEDDYEALKCLLQTMEGLLRWEPDKRMTIPEALATIEWTDYWAPCSEDGSDGEGNEEDGDGDGDGNGDGDGDENGDDDGDEAAWEQDVENK